MDVRSFPGLFLVGVLATSTLFSWGCGKSADNPAKDAAKDDSSASLNTDQRLVGAWYGKASLNQELLQKKLNAISDPVQREMLANIAKTFQTTEIGADFGANGEMTLDIQIQTAGQLLRDSTRGTWRTVKVQDNAVFVETTEPLPQGGSETNQARYQFEQNGRVAIMVAPTSAQLADCHPVFVFERVESASVADGADPGAMK